MITGITLIILSLIAVPSLLLAKRPDAKEILAKIAPYQGWIGLGFLVWGLVGIVRDGILGLGWMPNAPIFWATVLAVNVIQTVLGFMLGFGLLSQYVLSKNEEGKAKAEQLLAKLAPKQGLIGMVGIGTGVWCIVASIFFHA